MGQLRSRNRREVDPFRDLFQQLSRSAAPLPPRPDAAVTTAETAQLKKKLYELQEELTEMHRRKGENAQQVIIIIRGCVKVLCLPRRSSQVIDLSSRVRQLESDLSSRSSEVAAAHSEAQAARDELERSRQQLQELEATNQLLKDEYQALQLTLSGLEQRLEKGRRENDRLIAQVGRLLIVLGQYILAFLARLYYL